MSLVDGGEVMTMRMWVLEWSQSELKSGSSPLSIPKHHYTWEHRQRLPLTPPPIARIIFNLDTPPIWGVTPFMDKHKMPTVALVGNPDDLPSLATVDRFWPLLDKHYANQ